MPTGRHQNTAMQGRCSAAVGWSMVIGVSDDGQDGMADHQGQDVVQHGISWALAVSQRNVVTRAWIHRPLTNKSLTQEPALEPFHTCIVQYGGQPYPTRPGDWACQEAARRCWPWASSLQLGREINYGILQTYAPRFILPRSPVRSDA